MESFSNITKDNVAYYAATIYDNPHFTKIEQFHQDLRRISILKKQMNRFDASESSEECHDYTNKIVNNVVIFLNTFGREKALRILIVLMEPRFLRKLRPILEILFIKTPMIVPGVLNSDFIIEQVEIDEFFRQFISDDYRGMF